MDTPDWEIDDPRLTAAEAPYTFFLPSAAEIAAVDEGDLVQLVFRYFQEIEKYGAERMWVRVKAVEGDELGGILESQPYEPTSPLKAGDTVAFERHQIIDMIWAEPGAAPPREKHPSYPGGCVVDQCVLDGEELVEYLYRDTPEPPRDDERFHDTGWSIRGRMGDATATEMEARSAAYVALARVLNRDDSWIDWIDAPVGTRLLRDFETGTYHEVE